MVLIKIILLTSVWIIWWTIFLWFLLRTMRMEFGLCVFDTKKSTAYFRSDTNRCCRKYCFFSSIKWIYLLPNVRAHYHGNKALEIYLYLDISRHIGSMSYTNYRYTDKIIELLAHFWSIVFDADTQMIRLIHMMKRREKKSKIDSRNFVSKRAQPDDDVNDEFTDFGPSAKCFDARLVCDGL